MIILTIKLSEFCVFGTVIKLVLRSGVISLSWFSYWQWHTTRQCAVAFTCLHASTFVTYLAIFIILLLLVSLVTHVGLAMFLNMLIIWLLLHLLAKAKAVKCLAFAICFNRFMLNC